MQLVQDNLDEYEKICTALATTIDSLPRLEIYTGSFTNSQLLKDCVIDLFVAILQFWNRACKFYRRKRLWTLARSSWTDYDIEFSRLELAMNRNLQRVEKGAAAEHIAASNVFMVEQRSNMLALRQAHDLVLRKNLVASLAPQNGDITDFAHEHEAVRGRRHEKTCRWVLEHSLFVSWLAVPPEQHTTLWITAGPGAGKSTLASVIIDHLRTYLRPIPLPRIVFFYFKASSASQNNAADAMCSLIWQLCNQCEAAQAALESDTSYYSLDTTGLRTSAKVKNSRTYKASQQLERAFQATPDAILIIDGLDECQDCDGFLPKVLALCQQANIKALFTSRREEQIAQHLQSSPTLEITQFDIQGDVEAFSAFKIARSARLSHPLVRDKILEALVSRHEGMFLWVVLMFKELKACVTVEDVQSALNQLPTGLEAVYAAIVERLEKTLACGAIEVSRKVLAWVLGSGRPLSMDELREALCQQYKLTGNTLLANGQFPYADQEIEVICGSLVRVQFGKIQAVHETTTGYITLLARQNQPRTSPRILPDGNERSIRLAAVCLAYIAEKCGSPLTRFDNGIMNVERFNMEQFRTRNAFIEYACAYWAYHVLECPSESRDDAFKLLENTLTCSTTLSWIEASFLLEPRGLWRSIIATEELDDWVDSQTGNTKAESFRATVDMWCTGVLEFLESYGPLLAKRPWIAWLARVKQFPNHETGASTCSQCHLDLKEQEWIFEESLVAATQKYKLPAKAHLGHSQRSLFKAKFGFIVYEPRQKVYITGESKTEYGEELFVQETATGRRLPPATAPTDDYGYVVTAKVSDDGKYLAIAYSKWLSVWSIKSDIRFFKRLKNQEWAVRIFSHKYYAAYEELCAGMIAFGKDSSLFAPGGWYELPSTDFHTFGVLRNQPVATTSTHFSGNGEFIFRVVTQDSHTKINRIATIEPQYYRSELLVVDAKPEWSFVASYTGKYLVLMSRSGSWSSRTYEAKLLHIESQKSYDVASRLRHSGPGSFHFTRNDTELVTFLLGPRLERSCHADMTVSVWRLDSDVPQICSTSHFLVVDATHPETINNDPVCTIDGRDRGWIVSCERIVQAVRFSRSAISFPGLVSSTDERALWHSRVSQDAFSLGNVKIVGSNVWLQAISLCSSPPGEVLFERQFSLREEGYLPASTPMALSPNLDLLVVGSTAFTVDTEASSSPQTAIALGEDLAFLDHSSFHRDWTWTCTISNCGSYIAFEKPSYRHHMGSYDPRPGRSALIHIDRMKRVATRLRRQRTGHVLQEASERLRSPLEDVRPGLFSFHPSMPLATFSAIEGSGNDYNQGHPREPDISPAECALAVVYLNDDTTVGIESPNWQDKFRPRLQISDCGTFTYLDGASHKADDTKSRLLVSHLKCTERRLLSISTGQAAHPSLDRCYQLETGNGAAAIGLSMYTFTSDENSDTFPRLQVSEHCARISGLSFVPAEFGWYLRTWLLLGLDHSQPLRLLLFPQNGRPPVLRTLLHSWNDVVQELERQYAEHVNQTRHA